MADSITGDKILETFKQRVFSRLKEIDKDVIPSEWWSTVIKHYYEQGYSEDRTVRLIRETMNK